MGFTNCTFVFLAVIIRKKISDNSFFLSLRPCDAMEQHLTVDAKVVGSILIYFPVVIEKRMVLSSATQ